MSYNFWETFEGSVSAVFYSKQVWDEFLHHPNPSLFPGGELWASLANEARILGYKQDGDCKLHWLLWTEEQK